MSRNHVAQESADSSTAAVAPSRAAMEIAVRTHSLGTPTASRSVAGASSRDDQLTVVTSAARSMRRRNNATLERDAAFAFLRVVHEVFPTATIDMRALMTEHKGDARIARTFRAKKHKAAFKATAASLVEMTLKTPLPENIGGERGRILWRQFVHNGRQVDPDYTGTAITEVQMGFLVKIKPPDIISWDAACNSASGKLWRLRHAAQSQMAATMAAGAATATTAKAQAAGTADADAATEVSTETKAADAATDAAGVATDASAATEPGTATKGGTARVEVGAAADAAAATEAGTAIVAAGGRTTRAAGAAAPRRGSAGSNDSTRTAIHYEPAATHYIVGEVYFPQAKAEEELGLEAEGGAQEPSTPHVSDTPRHTEPDVTALSAQPSTAGLNCDTTVAPPRPDQAVQKLLQMERALRFLFHKEGKTHVDDVRHVIAGAAFIGPAYNERTRRMLEAEIQRHEDRLPLLAALLQLGRVLVYETPDSPSSGVSALLGILDVQKQTGELRTEVAELRTEMRTEVAELRTEMRTEVTELRTEVAAVTVRVDELGVRLEELRAGLSVRMEEQAAAAARLEAQMTHLFQLLGQRLGLTMH